MTSVLDALQPQVQRDPDGKDAPDAAAQVWVHTRLDDLNSAVDIMK